MPTPARLVTAEELQRFPDDDHRYELVEGRVIRMSPVGFQHGRIVSGILVLFSAHVRQAGLGVVLTEVGFKLRSKPDTVRAPDVSFIRSDRLPAADPLAFWSGPPDVAIEVLSPDDRSSEVNEKVEEYLAYGVRCVVVVDPSDRIVTSFRPGSAPIVSRPGDEIDLGDVVDGFRCRVAEIFE